MINNADNVKYYIDNYRIILNEFYKIFEKNFSEGPQQFGLLLKPATYHYYSTEDNKVNRYRRKYLVYNRLIDMKMPENSTKPYYNANTIYHNPILCTAAVDLSQAWTTKYGGIWDWEENMPRAGCSEFASWAINNSGVGLHPPQYPIMKVADLVKWFRDKNLYISPRDTTYNYAQLGTLIAPGFYASIKNGNHSVLFIYWIGPPSEGLSANPDVDEIIISLRKDKPKTWSNPKPGYFEPRSPINWFQTIGYGGTVLCAPFALVNLKNKRWFNKIINATLEKKGTGEGKCELDVMLWNETNDSSYSKYDGFGITSGGKNI